MTVRNAGAADGTVGFDASKTESARPKACDNEVNGGGWRCG